MRSMTRMAVAGCMALGAISAMAVLDVGSRAAEAAPSVSPFAGTYLSIDWNSLVTISDRGQITGPYPPWGSTGSISGRVSDDGSYSLTTSGTGYYYNPRTGGSHTHKFSLKSYGDMAFDLVGNIVATNNRYTDGYVWLRQ